MKTLLSARENLPTWKKQEQTKLKWDRSSLRVQVLLLMMQPLAVPHLWKSCLHRPDNKNEQNEALEEPFRSTTNEETWNS
eukprot:5821597-Amphidinium_carterae.1